MKNFDVLFWEQLEKHLSTQSAQEEMFEELHRSFVEPNEEKFRRNYWENSRTWNTVKYEECLLDFIPIADEEYLVLDRENKQCHGTFYAKPYKENMSVDKTVHSILIADEWDVKKILPLVLQKRWEAVYFLLNSVAKRFVSFLKVRGFRELFPPNVKFFFTTEEMYQYFKEDHDAYLPREIIAQEPEGYEALFKEIHEARIQSGIPSNNVFLSICIPSLNRGSHAIQAVQSVLAAQYDAEIEVVINNNGSTKDLDGYQQIKNLKDSRVRYCEFEKNGGYQVSYCDVLGKANGRFALTMSDEDLLIAEKLDEIFDYLIKNSDIAVSTFDPINQEINHKEKRLFKRGMDGVKWAHTFVGYFSGICYNMDIIKKEAILDQVEWGRGTRYYGMAVILIQCVICSFLGVRYDVSNSAIRVWIYGGDSDKGGILDDENSQAEKPGEVCAAALIESRCRQIESSVEQAWDILSEEDFKEFFFFKVNTIYAVSTMYFKTHSFKFEAAIGSWLDFCLQIYKTCLKLIEKYGLSNDKEFKEKMDKVFFYWIICKRLQKLHTPEENLLPSLQAQVIKYYHDKGIPIEKINFQGIEKDLESWVRNFLEKGVELPL